MDIGSLLLGLALLALVAFVVVRPLFERKAADAQPADPADHWLAERERVLMQLRDLDFDHSMGKINQEDYIAQRAQLVADGVAILKQLDALGVAADPASAAPADEIEAAVARRRAGRSPAAAVPPLPSRGLDAQIEASVAQRRASNPAQPSAAAQPVKVKPAARPPSPARGLDAEIEASVAQRRAVNPVRPAPLSAAEKLPGAAGLTCAQCGAAVLPDDRFCPKCGTAQMIACSHCGRVARAGDQFCAQCGQSLPAPDGQASLPS